MSMKTKILLVAAAMLTMLLVVAAPAMASIEPSHHGDRNPCDCGRDY